jgi:LmbE family N-acetylglucosaminyl deacetylase
MPADSAAKGARSLRARHALVVSPHLDDAVLSCGASIASLTEAGCHVTVVTVFTALPCRMPPPPLAQWFHARCGLGDDAMKTRTHEDLAAVASLGAEAVRLGLEECIYRRAEDGTPVYGAELEIFTSSPLGETAVASNLERLLAGLPGWRAADLVLAPLGIGGHVDHRIVRAAVETAAGRAGRTPLLYEDVPYLLYSRCRGWESELTHGLSPRASLVSGEQWNKKIQAIGHYASQALVLWEDAATWRDQLRSYASATGGAELVERLWFDPVPSSSPEE